MDTPVLAAGGVVWRVGVDGRPEVLVIHRQRYGDWTLPKGKLDAVDAGSEERCALREVAEETGYRCVLGPELSSTTYTDGQGRLKRVRYWAMTVVDGAFVPNREVDEVQWLPVEEARARLTYAHDVEVIDCALRAIAGPGGGR